MFVNITPTDSADKVVSANIHEIQFLWVTVRIAGVRQI